LKLSKFGDYEKIITLPVFSKYRVHIVFTDDVQKSAKERYGSSRKLDNCDGAHHYDDLGHSHLFYKPDLCINTLVHEAFHAVYALLYDWAGMDKLDEEVIAYHLGYITEQVENFHKEVLIARKSRKLGEYESK
jgi:hypothetical protein